MLVVAEIALAFPSDKKALLCYNKQGSDAKHIKQRRAIQMDKNSLAHTRWNCKYHIVFAPKFRRKEIYGKYKADIGKILRELCTWKGVEIIEAHACVDHVHMYVSIPPKLSVSGFVGFLKGKSALILFERHANLKYKYGQRHFWCRGFYVDTVGRNEKAIAEYVKNQEKEDMITDQISIKEYMDPFKKS